MYLSDTSEIIPDEMQSRLEGQCVDLIQLMTNNPSAQGHFKSTGTITASQYDVITSEPTTERRAEKLFDILTCRPVSCIKRGCQVIVGNPLSIVGGSMDDENAGDNTENSNLFIYFHNPPRHSIFKLDIRQLEQIAGFTTFK